MWVNQYNTRILQQSLISKRLLSSSEGVWRHYASVFRGSWILRIIIKNKGSSKCYYTLVLHRWERITFIVWCICVWVCVCALVICHLVNKRNLDRVNDSNIEIQWYRAPLYSAVICCFLPSVLPPIHALFLKDFMAAWNPLITTTHFRIDCAVSWIPMNHCLTLVSHWIVTTALPKNSSGLRENSNRDPLSVLWKDKCHRVIQHTPV